MAALHLGNEGYASDGVNGKVGVGTASPGESLEVNGGNVKVKNTSTNAGVKLDAATGRDPFVDFSVNGTLKQNIFFDGDVGVMKICEQNTPVYVGSGSNTVTVSGKLGVGTTGPTSKLTVAGGDIEVNDSSRGVIVKSPSGVRFRITVSDQGSVQTEQM